jgi:hypothetical protein
MTLPRSDSFVYEADKKLFQYMRQRQIRDKLRSRNVVMRLGKDGTLVFRCVRSSAYRHYYGEVRTQAYDTGRVYLDGFNRLELHAETFEEVPAIVAEMLRRITASDFRPQPWQYGDWMPERVSKAPPRIKTPFHQQMAELRRVKAIAQRAKFDAWVAVQPPPQPPQPLPPLTPEEAAVRQELSDKMVKEFMLEMDTNIIAELRELNPGS